MKPSDGGCWYCHTDDGDMLFSSEFDCFLHAECLVERIKSDKKDLETEIFTREFREVLESKGFRQET